MKILVVDGMGGGIGRSIVEALCQLDLADSITAVGTNSAATSNMLKGGAVTAATGENAIVYNAGKAEIVVAPIGVIIANSMHGEITPAMAVAVSSSDAKKVLVPIENQRLYIAGLDAGTLADSVRQAVELCVKLLGDREN